MSLCPGVLGGECQGGGQVEIEDGDRGQGRKVFGGAGAFAVGFLQGAAGT
ncbi:hypothetical protein P3T35_008124 [Kitasatospora sp. GP30]|nr:hypothetical protein [Kitasatospora sp. GP30]